MGTSTQLRARTRWAADAMAVASVAALLAVVLLGWEAGRSPVVDLLADGTLPIVLAFGAVGWLLSRRRPRNPIGWCFAGGAFVWALLALDDSWVAAAVADGHTGVVVRLGATVGWFGWIFAMPLCIQLPLLLLPDGRLLSPRWRPVPAAVVVSVVIGTVGFLTVPGPVEGTDPPLVNPLGVRWAGPLPVVLVWAGAGPLLVVIVAGVGCLVLRYVRSEGVARQQLRWVAVGGAAVILVSATRVLGDVSPFGSALSSLGIVAVPVCVGVAVLRYRLYDLGRLVSRTVSYAVITLALVGVYVGLVTAAVRLLSLTSSLAVAGSTLAVAALFQPLRRRVQAAVDRRFDRSRYDAARTVVAFRGRLREEVDLDTVSADLVGLVRATVQPATVGLWLRGTPPTAGTRDPRAAGSAAWPSPLPGTATTP